MASRPSTSRYLSNPAPPFELSTFSSPDLLRYLARLGLDKALADQPPSLELLSTLLMTHQLKVPYDSSSLHLRAGGWEGASVPIELGKGDGMQLGEKNFERIVGGQGGYCFALLTCFASLLRSFGFNVSDIGARVYLHRGQDPREAGYLWSSLTHHVLLVDWDGSEGRYLADVGFGGGGCPYPQLLVDGTTTAGLSPTESFLLRREPLPAGGHHRDPADGFTMYRRILPPGQTVASPATADQGPGYWSPCYHFSLSTISPDDIIMMNHYNETHPQAPFVNFFVVSILLPGGARRTLGYSEALGKEEEGRKFAKVWTKEGVKGEEYDVEWVAFETGPVGELLRKEFWGRS